MAGIYVHIPFCRSRCIYCDFYSTIRESEIAGYVTALCREAKERSEELGANTCVDTVYFGGGTPSLLTETQLGCILEYISSVCNVSRQAEVTVEMNPDDVARLSLPRGFGRVSLGIQTFDNGLLRILHRRHDAATAIEAVKRLQAAGCRNIGIDLIYGLPGQTMEQWRRDLDTAFALDIQHLSAYALSYEPDTPLHRMLLEGSVAETDEEMSTGMYYMLCERAAREGFEHYEISNFALPGFASRHNSSYWNGTPYLGLGPGAHSYDGQRTRRANIPDLSAYLRFWNGHANDAEGEKLYRKEVLSDSELFDEAVMCGLRTAQGIDLGIVAKRFGQRRVDYLMQMARPHLSAKRMALTGHCLSLVEEALMVADDVVSDLML